jgi:DNA-directed RNA polymerase specialized sigma24 family protein
VHPVLQFWRKGLDTSEIARLLRKPEADIERLLHRALDDERRKREREQWLASEKRGPPPAA